MFFLFSHFPSIFIMISQSKLLLHTFYLLLCNKCDYFLAFCPILVPEWHIHFLCHSTMNVCPNKAGMRAKYLVFTRRENGFTWHMVYASSVSCELWDAPKLRWVLCTLLHRALWSCCLPEDQPCSPVMTRLCCWVLGSLWSDPRIRSDNSLPVITQAKSPPRASHKQLSGFVWSQRSCGSCRHCFGH